MKRRIAIVSTLASAVTLAVILLIGHQAKAVTLLGCSNGVCALDLTTSDWLMIQETVIFPENVSNAPPGQYALRLEDTNPTFFALMANLIKDKKNTSQKVRLWYVPNFVGANGTYNKIIQVGLQ